VVIVDDGAFYRREHATLLRRLQTELADQPVKIVFHEHNRGKASSSCDGIPTCKRDVSVIQDADLEYDPREYIELDPPDCRGAVCLVVYGSRFSGGPRKAMNFWNMIASKGLTLATNPLLQCHPEATWKHVTDASVA
jgi:glycosyltransferase involved in cell wall biosynthesis